MGASRQHLGSVRASDRVGAYYVEFDVHATQWLGTARRLGLGSTVYTVNEPDHAHELIALGVDGIFTDRPDLPRLALAPRQG